MIFRETVFSAIFNKSIKTNCRTNSNGFGARKSNKTAEPLLHSNYVYELVYIRLRSFPLFYKEE